MKSLSTKVDPFRILHISDLHIRDGEDFKRSVILDPLIQKIEKDQKEGVKPEIVVVSGDIAFKGVEKEYDLAKKFFDELLASLNLGNDRIFIVPGNHDVNRKLYRPKDIPKYVNMTELNEELESSYYRSDLLKGMSDYFRFIEGNYPHLKSQNEKLVPFVAPYTTVCGKTIGIIGLNSAWMCRKYPDREKVAVGEYQIKKAMEALGKEKALDLQIFMFHHPLTWLWPVDKDICRKYFNNAILLCGHLHEPGGCYMEDLDGRLHHFQAGGAYVPSELDRQSRFQYLTFDWCNDSIKLDFRRFNPKKREWILDAETGDEGEKLFPMSSIATVDPQEKKKPLTSKKKPEEHKIFKSYLNSVLEEHRHLPTQGFETKVRISIELERIYVNMRAVIQSCDFTYTLEGKKQLRAKIQEENLSTLDIKATFTAARKYNIKDMVILGDPGSGKTTLLKYILIMLIQGRGEEKIGIDTGLIPFFAPLRELKDPDKEGFIDFIKRGCGLKKFAIQEKNLLSVLDSGSGIILLDGLDEVADEKTRIRTCQWIDDARIRFAKTRFIITSRFAGYLGKSRLEGNCLELSIQDFTKDEIKTFLIRWFESVEAIVHAGEDDTFWRQKGHQEALALFERIIKSEHIRKLAVTPLLLQIIALVHRDRGTLPQRRVELYEECTNVLLEKWDMAKGLNSLISAREARQVLQPLALWLHAEDERRSAPMGQIIKVIEGPLQDMGKTNLDMKKLLLNIRDRSGIFMGYSESEYGFTHLSFQEYLAAEQIRNEGKIDLLVEKYGEKWWKEVTCLCLALNNPSVIVDFMSRIIPTNGFKTDISLIMNAIEDSIVKPVVPFADALNNAQLPIEIRLNSIRVLKSMNIPKATRALKKVVWNKDNPSVLVRADYKALESLGETEGIEKPREDLTPLTITSPIDMAPMVLVPAGQFFFGSREDDKTASSDEKPQRVIDLPAFYIDRYPITNEQYYQFLNDTAPDEDTLREWIYLEGSFEKERCRIKIQREKFHVEKGYEKHPVIYVSWVGADAYAKWAGKRLPTEHEWEKAARGTEGAVYPWGNDFDKTLCNSRESKIRGTTPIDRFPAGKSPYGCFDMAGNVWEWIDTWYDKKKEWRVIRGGSSNYESFNCRCAYRYVINPFSWLNNVGFRCARI